MKNLLLLLVFTVCETHYASAQTDVWQQPMTWTSGESVMVTSGMTVNKSCSVTTDVAQQKIVIHQQNNENTFTITGTNGTWNDTSVVGSVVFTVTYDEAMGTITAGRDETGLFILVDMTPQGVKRKIIIDNVTTE